MREAIAAILSKMKPRGAFAVRQKAPLADLQLSVEGVGKIKFPVSATTAKKLCGVARQAPFGWRDQTLVDKKVRDTWEIAKSQIKIDAALWNKTLVPKLDQIKTALGLAAEGRINAQLHKMLVYEPGQLFAPHRDSEKADSMLGTLVVELPSAYKGGQVRIEHQGERVVYRAPRSAVGTATLLAFYADCYHEVQPIKEGHRVVLVYNLVYEGVSPDRVPIGTLQPLAAAIKAHFTTSPRNPYTGKPSPPPDRLVYLLDHEYTQKSLAWNRLKNGDEARVAALREVALTQDCEIFLALADVHETWSCEGDETYGWGRRNRYRDFYDDDDDNDDDDAQQYNLVDLCDSDIELRHLLPLEGQPANVDQIWVDLTELCCSTPSVDMEPFKSEHEGWMGNYGNTVDRWYHRAAVVLWPRSNNFTIRAKVDPQWALDEIKAAATTSLPEAQQLARLLLPFWNRIASQGSVQVFEKTLHVAGLLGDAALATPLLAPCPLRHFGENCVKPLIALVQQYGMKQCMSMHLGWIDTAQHGERIQWLPLLPTLCQALCDAGIPDGPAFARWLIAEHWSRLKKACQSSLAVPGDRLAELGPNAPILAVLQSCRVAEAEELHRAVVEFLMDPKADFPLLYVAALLHAAREQDINLCLEDLHAHCVTRLETTLAQPPRSPADWSVPTSLKCGCELCKALQAFLKNPSKNRLEWPLAEDWRRHIHRIVDSHRLPVLHTTTRVGRPYVLVLTKTDALFKQATDFRDACRRALAQLQPVAVDLVRVARVRR